MKVAVVDDDRVICEAIIRLIKKQEPEAEVCQFLSGKEMLETGKSFAIYFLDIAMEEMSGLELAKKIRQTQEKKGMVKSILIFITGYREYMEEAFDVNAFHYLVKPIDEEKFSEVFYRAWKEAAALEEQSNKYIIVRSSGIQQKILLKDIYYIESNNKKVIYHTKDGRLETYGKMEELENELGNAFYRCHRCYLVNMEKISAYSTDMIQVVGGDKLILAQKKYADFIKHYMRYAKDGGIVNV